MNQKSNLPTGYKVPSLAWCLEQTLQRQLVAEKRMKRLRSALNAYSRLTGKLLDDLPAHRPSIQIVISRYLKRLEGEPGKRKSLQNHKSELLWLVCMVVGRGPRSALDLLPEWHAFSKAINPPVWWQLSRFAGFASARGIGPQDVTDELIENFVTELALFEEVNDPKATGRRVLRALARLGVDQPVLGLPVLELKPQKRRRWTLEENCFPGSFSQDIDRWLNRNANDDPFDGAASKPLRPQTIQHRRHQLFKSASALVFSGQREVADIKGLSDLVTREAFQAIIRYLLDRQHGVKTEALYGLALALQAAARHHVGVDADTDRFITDAVARLKRGYQSHRHENGLSNRTRKRLAAVEDPKITKAILRLPMRLLRLAQTAKTPRRASILAQLSVATEIELFAPMRVANLVSLQIGANLHRLTKASGKRGKASSLWQIAIPGNQVKNGHDLAYELPPQSVELIDAAMKLYDQTNGYLFPGRGNGHKAASLLSRQIGEIVSVHVGIEWNTHLYRSFAAYLILRDNPDGFERVRLMLGNRDDAVLRECYAFLAERSMIEKGQQAMLDARLVIGDISPKDRSTDKD